MANNNTVKYFILTKDNKELFINEDNQIFSLNNKKSYLLPANNLDYTINNGLFENTLIEWVKEFCSSDKTFLDIGAHTGTYTISLAKLCKNVIAFEPQKMTYYALCGGVALSNLNNVTCYNFGLGSSDQVGMQTLNIVSVDGGGSTLFDDNLKKNNQKILSTEKIEIKTLDSLNLTNIGFIKMDVEENELNVLRGGLETLKKSGYPKILFESNDKNEELFNFIKEIGYNISPVTGYSNMFLATI